MSESRATGLDRRFSPHHHHRRHHRCRRRAVAVVLVSSVNRERVGLELKKMLPATDIQ